MNRSIFLALGLTLAASAAQAQTSAITYPPLAPRPASSATLQPAVVVQGERFRIERPRIVTEPPHGVFVYEALGATPRLRLMRTPAQAAASAPVTVAAQR